MPMAAMSVYAVLLLSGQAVASIGPWPADLANCSANIPESNRDLDAAFADPAKVAKLREAYPDIQRDQVQWACIKSVDKPAIAKTRPKPSSDRMAVGD